MTQDQQQHPKKKIEICQSHTHLLGPLSLSLSLSPLFNYYLPLGILSLPAEPILLTPSLNNQKKKKKKKIF